MAFGEASLPESSITIDGFIYFQPFFLRRAVWVEDACAEGKFLLRRPAPFNAELRKLLCKKCFNACPFLL